MTDVVRLPSYLPVRYTHLISMRTALALSILAVLGGCTVGVGPGAGSTEAPLTGTVGVLEVERHVDADGALITAAFARYQGLSEGDVLPLIGTSARAELDACVLVDDALSADAIAAFDPAASDVELIDAGTVEVRLADVTTRLVPRTFPDVASVMAGVFYAGEATLPLPSQDDAYVLRSAGSGQVGAFELSLASPSEVTVVVFGDDDGAVARDRMLEFSWLPGATADGDVVEIELASRGGTLACRATDDGSFRIEPSVLANLAADSDAELLVRRVRTRSFTAEGLDSAYARLAITRTERVVVR
jgi:hypothetical protein